MREAFHMGGWGMYPTAFFGVLMIGISIRYALQPDKRYVPLQVSLGIMTFLAGALGFVTGLIASFSHLDQVPADHKWISLLGVGESLNNVALALALIQTAMLAIAVGAYRLSRAEPIPETVRTR